MASAGCVCQISEFERTTCGASIIDRQQQGRPVYQLPKGDGLASLVVEVGIQRDDVAGLFLNPFARVNDLRRLGGHSLVSFSGRNTLRLFRCCCLVFILDGLLIDLSSATSRLVIGSMAGRSHGP